jgi:hypothetical protein
MLSGFDPYGVTSYDFMKFARHILNSIGEVTEMTSTRKNLRVTITGETFNDLELALEQVKYFIENECSFGFASNDTGSYSYKFDVTVGN